MLASRRIFLWGALLIWGFLLLMPLRIAKADRMRDFEVYWTAGARALSSAPLYRAEDGHFQLKYLPAFAVAASPASLLPLELAKGKWLVISVGLLAALIALSIRVLPERRRATWVLVVAILVAMGKFYGHELVLGQVNLLFGVIATASVLALGAGAPALAAAGIVAAVVVKPYAVIFLPWITVVGGWRAAASAAIGMTFVLVAPVGLYGLRDTIQLHLAWWETVTTSTAPNLTNPDNVSVAALAAKWLGAGPPASAFAALLSVVLVAFAVFIVVRGRGMAKREVLEGAVLLTLIPLISPQGWDYVFLVSTPAVAILVNYEGELPAVLRAFTWIALATIGLSLFDLLGRQRYATFMSWSVITVCYFVLLAALGTLRLRRAA